MKKRNILLIAGIVNATIFVWIYLTHLLKIKWDIAGVFHELLMIPMILLAPVLVLLSSLQIKKYGFKTINIISFIIPLLVTLLIMGLIMVEIT